MSLAYLAKVSACSIPTVRKAVEDLEAAGYIRRCRNYQYSDQAGRVVYAPTTYVCTLSTARDYTLVPREVFSGELTLLRARDWRLYCITKSGTTPSA